MQIHKKSRTQANILREVMRSRAYPSRESSESPETSSGQLEEEEESWDEESSDDEEPEEKASDLNANHVEMDTHARTLCDQRNQTFSTKMEVPIRSQQEVPLIDAHEEESIGPIRIPRILTSRSANYTAPVAPKLTIRLPVRSVTSLSNGGHLSIPKDIEESMERFIDEDKLKCLRCAKSLLTREALTQHALSHLG